MSFDIEEQGEKAKEEDKGTEVFIHGVDEKPAFYTDEDGAEQPVTIIVAGMHSTQFRRAEELLRKRKLKARNFTGEAVYDDNIEKVAACTLGWAGFTFKGEQVQCTPHNVKELYKKCPWVLDQVLEAMQDHARFFNSGSTRPSTTSSPTLDS